MLHRLSEIDIPTALSPAIPRWVSQAGIALALIGATVVLRRGIDVVAPGALPFGLIFPAILIATVLGGAMSGILTLIVGGGLAWWAILPPQNSFALETPAALVSLAFFILSSCLVIFVIDAFRISVKLIAAERQALHNSEERFRLVAENAPVNLWMGDATGSCVYLNRTQREFWGVSDDLGAFSWNDMLLPEDREGLFAVFTSAMASETAFEVEARYFRADGQVRTLATKAQPRRDINGKFLGMIGVNVDVTEVRQSEKHQRLLINELNHRVKNTLATVQSLAYQTIRGDNLKAKTEDFFGRLMALSAAHDVLTRENWESVALSEVVRHALMPFDVDGGERFTVEGPEVRLSPRIALALALGLHELATNAVKYGALKGAGSVAIGWELAAGDAAQLVWREQGGPTVKTPTRRGFGSRLLQEGLAGDLGSSPVLAYPPEGVSCHFAFPIERDGPRIPAAS